MATVINRTTRELRRSVHTPDFPTQDWIHEPDLSAVISHPMIYWKIVGDSVQLMDAGEQATVDAAIIAAARAASKVSAKAEIDGNSGYDLRALAKLTIDEINSLRQWITSFKAATAAATNLANFQSRVAALANTPDRTLAQAKTAYDNLIDGSDLDE